MLLSLYHLLIFDNLQKILIFSNYLLHYALTNFILLLSNSIEAMVSAVNL
jgi:hypothetical protein